MAKEFTRSLPAQAAALSSSVRRPETYWSVCRRLSMICRWARAPASVRTSRLSRASWGTLIRRM